MSFFAEKESIRFFLIACVLIFHGATHQAHGDASTVPTSRLETILNSKLEAYRQNYPDIMFLHLRGGDSTVEDMARLGKKLGNAPINRDYEHPPELQNELVNVSLNRILLLLQARMPSSSLYEVVQDDGNRKHLCVLSLFPEEIAGSSLISTRHLLDQTEKFVRKIPENMWLPAEDYLEFVIDHEIYHCLYSLYVEPQPMSQLELWGDYFQYLNEQGADAYALAKHLARSGKKTQFTEVLALIRGTSISSADANHRTCRALDKVQETTPEEMKFMEERDFFEFANNIRGELKLTYDQYLVYLASAIDAMEQLGLAHLVEDELRDNLDGAEADPAEVKRLVEHNNYCLGRLAGSKAR